MACGNKVTWGCGPTTRMSPDPPGETSALMELGRDCTPPPSVSPPWTPPPHTEPTAHPGHHSTVPVGDSRSP